MAADSRNM